MHHHSTTVILKLDLIKLCIFSCVSVNLVIFADTENYHFFFFVDNEILIYKLKPISSYRLGLLEKIGIIEMPSYEVDRRLQVDPSGSCWIHKLVVIFEFGFS